MYLSEITAHLHGNNAEMVLLVAPDQEGLSIVVENAASGRPETTGVRRLEETVALLEEEVIVDQLLLHFLAHASERVKSALQFAGKTRQRARYFLLHLLILGLGQARIEWISVQGAAASHASRHDVLTL